MKDFEEKDFRYSVDDPKSFEQSYVAAKTIIETYPKEIEREKIWTGVFIAIGFVHFVLYCLKITSGWFPCVIFGLCILRITMGFFETRMKKKYIKLAHEAKERYEFVISFNSTPRSGDEWKGPRNPYE